MKEDLFKGLNEEQVKAARHGDGPLLILAGAGSGKTRVVTCRVAHLVNEKKVDPLHILAVTFTNKAAQEMRERVGKLVGSKGKDIWVSTFHSSCVRILRKEIQALGYTQEFVIYDRDDSERLVKESLHELRMDEKQNRPGPMLGRISAAKSEMVSPADYADSAKEFYEMNVAKVYTLYQQKIKRNNALDFDDLLNLTVQIFQQFPEALARWQSRFHYIMVDEYQDINTVQYQFTNLLAHKHHNVAVVGDEDQSIYKFRGADIRNILNFEKDYPDAVIIKLEQNYRSAGNILKGAWQVIRNNTQRKDKVLWTSRTEGEKIAFVQAMDERDEAARVVAEIQKRRMAEAKKFSDFVILYRTNAQSRVFEDALRLEGIPYIVIGGIRFYDRMEVKDVLAFLRLVINPQDGISLMRIVNVPSRGLSEGCLEKVRDFSWQQGLTLYDAMGRAAEIATLTTRQREALLSFHGMIEHFRARAKETGPFTLAKELIEKTGYLHYWQVDDSAESKNRVDNIKELVTALKEYEERRPDGTLGGFLEQVALVQETEKLTDKDQLVTMMTIHNAKGLEYPVVFLTGMEEGLFPHNNSIAEDFGIEEERRLCYVGMTRAKEKLMLSCAAQRRSYGNPVWNPVSRFIEEIDPEVLESERAFLAPRMDRGLLGESVRQRWGYKEGADPEQDYTKGDEPVGNVASLESDSETDMPPDDEPAVDVKFSKGDHLTHLIHPEWGRGTLIDKSGSGDKTKVTVSFMNVGRKDLMLKYAKLKKI